MYSPDRPVQAKGHRAVQAAERGREAVLLDLRDDPCAASGRKGRRTVLFPSRKRTLRRRSPPMRSSSTRSTLINYGTLEAPVNEKLEAGYDVILEIEVQGAMQVHEKRPDAVMVFIAPPSFEELANRLRGRGTEDEAKVQKRLETAKGELAQQDKFDYVVVNDTVERAVEELHGILAKRR